MEFSSQILIHPGLGSSDEMHWQTFWEKRYPSFVRIQQQEWETPDCNDWIATLDAYTSRYQMENVILVGHSAACCAIVRWAETYKRNIKGALLVAPGDSEAASFPRGTKGFSPMPAFKLPFPTITVISSNDHYVSMDRARTFANAWGSHLINIGSAGHINADSKLGFWEFGLELLKRLD